jgi:hypothetical protein
MKMTKEKISDGYAVGHTQEPAPVTPNWKPGEF